MPAGEEQKILIAGGGIGGLSAAIALGRKGFPVRVLEREAEFSRGGAGIQLGPNGTRLLQSWGLDKVLAAKAGAPQGVRIWDGLSGLCLTTLPLGEVAQQRYGAPYWVLRRAHLQGALLEAAAACGKVEISRSFGVQRFKIVKSGVEVTSAAGETVTGQALIGADGLRSAVRRNLFPDARLSYSGKTAWRASIAVEDAPAPFRQNMVGLWLAPHSHLVHYPVDGGKTLNAVAVVDAEIPPEDWGAPGDAAAVTAHYRRWAPLAQDLLHNLQDWRSWPLMTLPSLARWSKGPVTLLGDAAHPVLPFLASGGVLAIEDAAVLAEEFCGARSDAAPEQTSDQTESDVCSSLLFERDLFGKPVSTFPDHALALRRYEARRKARARRVQQQSASTGKVYHLDGLMRWARNRVLANAPPRLLLRRNDWLYRFSAAAAP